MFAKACEKAMKFTHPLIVSTRTVDGTLASYVGTYFFISKDGWAISAAHVFNSFMKFQYDQKHMKEVEESRAKDEREGRQNSMVVDPTWITNHSSWFGADQIRLSQLHIFANYDLAAFKLENVPENFTQEIAVFGDSESLKIGTSLCRLGYPFVEFKPEFKNNNFCLPNEVNHLPPFPNEGIFTRIIYEKNVKDAAPVKLLETSSPGLKGQSGGPIFDVNGCIYAMQTKTAHMDLGFAPTYEKNGESVTEHQFMNVGVGLHIDIIEKLLLDKKIPFQTVNKGTDGYTYVIN